MCRKSLHLIFSHIPPYFIHLLLLPTCPLRLMLHLHPISLILSTIKRCRPTSDGRNRLRTSLLVSRLNSLIWLNHKLSLLLSNGAWVVNVECCAVRLGKCVSLTSSCICCCVLRLFSMHNFLTTYLCIFFDLRSCLRRTLFLFL